jgi:hypothetical protein
MGNYLWGLGWLRQIGWGPGVDPAGPDLRSQGSSKKERLSRCARGVLLIASRARSGPIPLPPVLPEATNSPPIVARYRPSSGEPSFPVRQGHRHGFAGSRSTDHIAENRKSFPDPVPRSTSPMRRTLENDPGMRRGRSMPGLRPLTRPEAAGTFPKIETTRPVRGKWLRLPPGNPNPRARSVASAGNPPSGHLRTPRS